ncbi:MAG: XRE family transcriptional regulator [Moorea sp. SIO3G5]|nr:XRE family transcriptional regulator [Moorena sp. SIO3G5]
MNNNPYIGSSLDELLEEDNILAEVEAVALKRVLAWQIEQAMLEKGLTKTEMTKVMKTTPAALDRLLKGNREQGTGNRE